MKTVSPSLGPCAATIRHVPRGDKLALHLRAMTRVLGIDPGLRLTGYGLVDVIAGQFQPRLVEAGVIQLDPKTSMESRLVQLYHDLDALLEQFEPDDLAVEKLYSHYAHPRTAIIMGHARGVILLAGKKRGLNLVDLPATEVKKAVTGHGHASKEQMQLAVQSQCNLAQPPSPPDVADAIAVALCHARRLAIQHL